MIIELGLFVYKRLIFISSRKSKCLGTSAIGKTDQIIERGGVLPFFFHDSIKHSPQPLIINRDGIDNVGITITLDNGDHLAIKSLYSPCGSKDIQRVLESELSVNNTVIFGDFNARSLLWEQSAGSNKAGRGVEYILSNFPDTSIFHSI